MGIVSATKEYERWLGARLVLDQRDLDDKHEEMASDPFSFLRATFYRWVQVWKNKCSDLDSAPEALAIGDIHVQNFGSWRDSEGRLVWGINDFDEAHPMAYTLDLVRLATSICLSVDVEGGPADQDDICEQVHKGYSQGIQSWGYPYVLAEYNQWLREPMEQALKNPERFWEKFADLPDAEDVPAPARLVLQKEMPRPPKRILKRAAGLGSLGRQRFVGVEMEARSRIAREVKALTASSYQWATDPESTDQTIYYNDIIDSTVKSRTRSRDPFMRADGSWAVRRLSPDNAKIDIESVDKEFLLRLSYAMGWETANVHIGNGQAKVKKIVKDIEDRKKHWLTEPVEIMLAATYKDYYEWGEYWQTTGES